MAVIDLGSAQGAVRPCPVHHRVRSEAQSSRASRYTGHEMRRWLLKVLLVLLPLQFVWAAAAPYCGHEQASDAQHVGHHEHVHGTPKSNASDAVSSFAVGDVSPTLDTDCAYCQHSACKSVVFEVPSLADIAQATVQAPADAAPPCVSPIRSNDPIGRDSPESTHEANFLN